MESTYVLNNLKGAVANIGIEGKAKVQPKRGSTFGITLNSQEQTGRYCFDTREGVLRVSELVQKSTMTVTVGGQAAATELEWAVKMELMADDDVKPRKSKRITP